MLTTNTKTGPSVFAKKTTTLHTGYINGVITIGLIIVIKMIFNIFTREEGTKTVFLGI